MEDANEANDKVNVDLSPNAVTLLQRRHTKPLSSHLTYLYPGVQPTTASEARGENPWTGQTAEEVREAAYSEQQYQRLQREKEQAPRSAPREAGAPDSSPNGN
jgi:hypothetical protein